MHACWMAGMASLRIAFCSEKVLHWIQNSGVTLYLTVQRSHGGKILRVGCNVLLRKRLLPDQTTIFQKTHYGFKSVTCGVSVPAAGVKKTWMGELEECAFER